MFETTRVLNFGDCDPSGIAYYPSYLNHLNSVIEEFFGKAGTPWSQMIRDLRIGTPTLRLDLTFERPGFHGDVMTFAIRLVAMGGSSMDLEHTVSANGETLWSARHRLVATSLETHRSIQWPDEIRAGFAPYLENKNV